MENKEILIATCSLVSRIDEGDEYEVTERTNKTFTIKGKSGGSVFYNWELRKYFKKKNK